MLPRFLLDTDHLTLYQHRHVAVLQHLAQHPPDAVGLTIVTAEEALRGRLALVARARDSAGRISRYADLLATIQLLGQLQIVAYDSASEIQFQQLRVLRLRIGSRDLKIAAIALAQQLILVTRNRRDFGQIPGLVIEDWSV